MYLSTYKIIIDSQWKESYRISNKKLHIVTILLRHVFSHMIGLCFGMTTSTTSTASTLYINLIEIKSIPSLLILDVSGD